MERNLTQGKIGKSILLFSIPMILGNLLQQFYNIVDTYIVGQYIGSNALAAVGSSYTLMTFLTSIIIGLCMGSGILFSMYFGAKKYEKMKISFFCFLCFYWNTFNCFRNSLLFVIKVYFSLVTNTSSNL